MSHAAPPSEASADKRARILRAALEVGQRRGIASARMEEVAQLARVSKGTLYRHFESKEDLFLAMVIDSYEESNRILGHEANGGSDPAAMLAQRLDGLVEVLAAVAPRMTVHYQAWGLIAGDPGRRERLYGFLRDFHRQEGAKIADTIRAGQRELLFAGDADPEVFADGIMALLGGFLYRATFDASRASGEKLRRCFAALVRDIESPRGPEEPSHG